MGAAFGGAKTVSKSTDPNLLIIKKIAIKKPQIPDPIHHKRLDRRLIIIHIFEPIPDQQIRTKPNPLPADKEDDEIRPQHQATTWKRQTNSNKKNTAQNAAPLPHAYTKSSKGGSGIPPP